MAFLSKFPNLEALRFFPLNFAVRVRSIDLREWLRNLGLEHSRARTHTQYLF